MKFNIVVKAIILSTHPDKILLCHNCSSNIYHIPGIDVTPGNSVIDSTKDYLKKSLDIDPQVLYFVGVMEHITKNEHIFLLFFKADEFIMMSKLPENGEYRFEWQLLPLARSIAFEPKYLKEDLSRWLKGKEIFLSTKDKAFSA